MNWVTRSIETAWGIFTWLSFALAVLLSLIVVLIVPSAKFRQKFVTWAARMTFVLPMIEVHVSGMDNLPTGNCVVVANHASYLDGILLKGFLPARFSFVIKGEMRNVPIAHFLMRRSGARFVERFKSSESARDARQIVKAARSGESLGFFPEGTFLEERGVGRFRAGAFMAAIKGGMPVVPIAISGTREMLGAGRALPRPTPIRIDILDPILPDDPAYRDHHSLAETARQRILAVLDEPDLLATLD